MELIFYYKESYHGLGHGLIMVFKTHLKHTSCFSLFCKFGHNERPFYYEIFCLSKIQLFTNLYFLLTHDRSSYELLKAENKTKIDQVELERECAVSDHKCLFFYKFVLLVKAINMY